MKLSFHEHVIEHFQGLAKNREATLELLMHLKLESDLSDYQPILGYLTYWSEEH